MNTISIPKKDNRIPALIRFASAITILNIFGHLYLGFEQSYAHAFVALATAYITETLMEFLSAKTQKRTPAYAGGFKKFIIFLLPAHITGLAVSMLTYTNTDLRLVVFGVAVALLSKVILRVTVNNKPRHFLNPSNTGIAILFLVFPSVGSAPPYQFIEATNGGWDWFVISIFLCLGTFLNAKFTKKIPLIAAWLIGFFLQAVIRTNLMDTSTLAGLGVMTGPAFLLFTFYMVSDPSTTPVKFKNQICFGASVAFVYGILMALHIVFGLFIALFSVCMIRGAYLWYLSLSTNKSSANKEKATTAVRQHEAPSILLKPSLTLNEKLSY